MESLTKIFYVAIGGAFGSVARYGVSLIFGNAFIPFPLATFLVNVTGSFLIGVLVGAKILVSSVGLSRCVARS